MKYENAKDVLPPELIAQIQKYAAGKLLYIPRKEEPKAWGSLSGSRQKLLKRNQRIYNEYRSGKGVGELAEEYFLSVDSIKKIIYGKKGEWIPFEPTLECARLYNEAGLAEEWLRTYYVKKFGENTYPEQWILDGMVKIPLRLVGAASGLEEDGDNEGAELNMPLIFLYRDGEFVFQGSRSLLKQLKAKRINSVPAFIFVVNKGEYASYMVKYGRQFHQAKM